MASRSSCRYQTEGVEITPPYKKLASYYRKIMEHVDYIDWAFYLTGLLKKHGREPCSLLELGAGTGILSKHFKPVSIKQRVTTDISFEMIRCASPETAQHRAVVDAANLPFSCSFDMMLMTYDAINYLSRAAINSLFQEAFRLLSDTGVFIFDITTEYNSLTYFENAADVEELGDDVIARRCWYEAFKHKQYNQFDFFTLQKDGSYLRETEVHEQNVYPVSFFKKAAENASLEVEGIYADFSTDTELSCAERIHFVLSKKNKTSRGEVL